MMVDDVDVGGGIRELRARTLGDTISASDERM